MQRQLVLIVAAAALLGLGLPAGMVPQEGAAQATDEWEYRWEARADGTSQVWRRPAGESAADWLDAGTIPQQVVEIVSDSLEPDRAIALTRQALYRTENAGGQWGQVPGLPDWPTAVALGREHPGLIYLGTLTGGVYRSLDAGASWQPLPWDLDMMAGPFVEVTALAVHPEDDEIVYAAAGHWLGSTEQRFTPAGIAISQDGGQSWQVFDRAELDYPRVTGLEPDPEQPLRVLARSQAGARWITMEDAALHEPGPPAVDNSGPAARWLPAQRADRALAPAESAGTLPAGRQEAVGGIRPAEIETEGWLLLALAGIALAGAGLQWALSSRGCSDRSLRH